MPQYPATMAVENSSAGTHNALKFVLPLLRLAVGSLLDEIRVGNPGWKSKVIGGGLRVQGATRKVGCCISIPACLTSDSRLSWAHDLGNRRAARPIPYDGEPKMLSC